MPRRLRPGDLLGRASLGFVHSVQDRRDAGVPRPGADRPDRPAGGSPRRPVCARRDAVRAGDRRAALRRRRPVAPDPRSLARVPTPPAALDPSLPAAFSPIVLRLLEKEPDERYQTADGVVYDLERVRDAAAGSARPSASASVTFRCGSCRRRGSLGAAGGGGAAGGLRGGARRPLSRPALGGAPGSARRRWSMSSAAGDRS